MNRAQEEQGVQGSGKTSRGDSEKTLLVTPLCNTVGRAPYSTVFTRCCKPVGHVPANEHEFRVHMPMAQAAAESQRLKTTWADRYGLRESKRSQVCVCSLYGAKGCRKYVCQNVPPASDHATLWNLDGKPAVFVMQPYGPIQADQLVLWCHARNLDVEIGLWPAWRYPGHVLHVEIATPGGFLRMEQARQKRLTAKKSKG